ncbi:sigma-70 family RNA polymerase sigma factor [Micromonospora sp. NPDC005215]|uniref:RNA polymerase sigma factor n=1 Tax=Micromonospora sp. NPDC005215 TaxID=3157024 RepID=UPI0033A841D6
MDDRTADKPGSISEAFPTLANEIAEQLKVMLPGPATSATAWAMDRKQVVEEFSAFYRAFATRLAGWLILQGASEADAYDVMQETMYKAYHYWHTIEHPKAWVRATASRAYAERLARLDPVPIEEIAERLPPLPSGSALADLKQDIRAAMQQLPPRQRQVLAWSFEGHTPAEIGAQLRMTSEAVRSSRYKARKALTELLRDREGDAR